MVGEFAWLDNCGCFKHPFPCRKAAECPPGGRQTGGRPLRERTGRENHGWRCACSALCDALRHGSVSAVPAGAARPGGGPGLAHSAASLSIERCGTQGAPRWRSLRRARVGTSGRRRAIGWRARPRAFSCFYLDRTMWHAGRAPLALIATRTGRDVRPAPTRRRRHRPVHAGPYPTQQPAIWPPGPARCRAARPLARADRRSGRRHRQPGRQVRRRTGARRPGDQQRRGAGKHATRDEEGRGHGWQFAHRGRFGKDAWPQHFTKRGDGTSAVRQTWMRFPGPLS
ncbi:hypothetical protein GEM_1710 [Burkholderia cepacia GG4]|uniref:Uncharacterized protein n=1 Tax=Burkholderia cepacia GG4 TaxID=1009846 RepID=A0A9W3P961_BURCE|nr:hypothetical protein GEM_1710 [Burkholderia cepacia GG4]